VCSGAIFGHENSRTICWTAKIVQKQIYYLFNLVFLLGKTSFTFADVMKSGLTQGSTTFSQDGSPIEISKTHCICWSL